MATAAVSQKIPKGGVLNLMYHTASSFPATRLLAEVDLSHQEYVRQNWPFFRDRRVDVFGDLTQRAL